MPSVAAPSVLSQAIATAGTFGFSFFLLRRSEFSPVIHAQTEQSRRNANGTGAEGHPSQLKRRHSWKEQVTPEALLHAWSEEQPPPAAAGAIASRKPLRWLSSSAEVDCAEDD